MALTFLLPLTLRIQSNVRIMYHVFLSSMELAAATLVLGGLISIVINLSRISIINSHCFCSILLKNQCGFRKGFNAKHCLTKLLEKWT